jgi:hypothetical protein
MSQPIPGAPADQPPADQAPPATGDQTGNGPTGNQAPAPANNPTPPAGDPAGTGAEPPKGDEGTDWRGHAKTWEKRANQHKTAAEQAAAELKAEKDRVAAILKAAGIGDNEDPAEAAKRTATERDEAMTRAEKAEAEAKALRAERYAEKAARKAGADVDLLLDSRGFEAALRKLDPTSDTFEADVKAAVDEALAANPRLKATADAPPRTVNPPAGGGAPDGPRSIDDIRAERRKRRLG